MNEPAPAVEVVDETEQGKPNPLDPHMGHLDPDQKPDGNQEPAPDAKKADDGGDTPAPGEDNAETQPDGDAIQRKVGELAYENRELKRQLEARQQKPAAEETPEPLKTLKDFNYDEQAFNGYLIEKGAELGEKRARAAVQNDGAATAADARQKEFEIREDAFEAEVPGFKERLHADDLMISPEMAMFIADPTSDVGLHVGDYLSQNKTEAAKIAGMSPVAAMREMTKLETRIGKEVAKAKAAKDEVSNAPKPPANAIDGSDPGVKTLDPTNPEDSEKMSDEEWVAARNKQEEARRK